jgi:hypothetical protein
MSHGHVVSPEAIEINRFMTTKKYITKWTDLLHWGNQMGWRRDICGISETLWQHQDRMIHRYHGLSRRNIQEPRSNQNLQQNSTRSYVILNLSVIKGEDAVELLLWWWIIWWTVGLD